MKIQWGNELQSIPRSYNKIIERIAGAKYEYQFKCDPFSLQISFPSKILDIGNESLNPNQDQRVCEALDDGAMLHTGE